MELHSVDRKLLVLKAHDLLLFCLGRHREAIGKSFALDKQGMIARGLEGIVQAAEKSLAIVVYQGSFAVHQARRTGDFPAENLAYALMPEAHAEYGNFSAQFGDHRFGNPRLLGTAGAGRNDDLFRLFRGKQRPKLYKF
mgnify:CR=1 FL=1